MSNSTNKSTPNIQYSVSTPQLPTNKSPANVKYPSPLPTPHNAKRAIVTTQSESDEDLEFEEYSDKETQ